MASKPKKPRGGMSALSSGETIPVSVQEAFDFLDVLQATHPLSSALNESALSSISEFIDSGSLSLNAIMSGRTDGGVPSGRIVGYAGPSACGKTVMICNFIRNAQKKGRVAIVFDSEAAFDVQTAVNLGCDATKIKYVPVDCLESWETATVKVLDMIIANPKLRGKFVMCLDSLGNLASEKELLDSEKGHHAADMGTRAKIAKSVFRKITYKLAVCDVPLVFTNHLYDDPSAMFESIRKNQSGGKGPEYMSTILVQFGSKLTKGTDGTVLAKETSGAVVTGVELSALTVKNRIVPPYMQTEMAINYLTGFLPYAGLVEMAKALGVVRAGGAYIFLGEKNLGYAKDIEADDKAWDEWLLPAINKALKEQVSFSSLSDEDEDLEEEAEEEPEVALVA